MGTLLACRSDRRPAWALLGLPNPLLWLGWISEPLLASALVLVILVDALDKRWRHPGQLPPRFSRSLAAVPR
ncbi:hypothetical protein, partial [Synechococcus sp. BA-132 BA5]|uniref:hypothetical protein n=1 Tax=Synechococcus sp. BA-132 BA5 TaxID=3110252 RepID=UPI002B200F68